MEIWDWLRPWWNWWAGATDLFDWEAVGAMGTLGTLAAALYLADAANRDRRRRDAAIILAVAHPVETAAGILRSGQTNVASGLPSEIVYGVVMQTEGLRVQHQALDSFNLSDLPSVEAIDRLAAAKAAVQMIEKDIISSLEMKGLALATLPHQIDDAIARLDGYNADLRAIANRIRRRGGPF